MTMATVIALIKALGGGGGSSGGGGVLIVKNNEAVLDHTFQEIYDAGFSVWEEIGNEDRVFYHLKTITDPETQIGALDPHYAVSYFGINSVGSVEVVSFATDTPSGYPEMED